MINPQQNRFVERIANQALRGGGYDWGGTPISDSQSPNHPGFRIIDSGQGSIPAERYEPSASFRRMDPQKKFRAGAKNMEKIRGEAIALEMPVGKLEFEGPSRLSHEDFAGSGPGNALHNVDAKSKFEDALEEFVTLLNEEDVDEEEAAGLTPGESDERAPRLNAKDKKKRTKDNWSEQARREKDDNERHVSADRKIAFDMARPLSNEMLQPWFGYLHRKINAQGPAHPWFQAAKSYIERLGGGKRYHELNRQEKATLDGIIERIVEAA
jgi:hypothetical protein